MKRVATISLLALFVFTSVVGNVSGAELKVGYVDMQRIFAEYKKTKEAEAKLEKEGRAKTDERNKMVEGIRRLKDELELLSDKGKEAKQAEIDDKIKELQNFDRTARTELIQQREDVLRTLTKEIDKTITDYGKKHTYDLILNKDRRILLFEKEDLDITDSILRTLNK